MQIWAVQRDDARIQAWLIEFNTFYYLEDVLVLDETGRDTSAICGSFGWGARGCPPVQRHLPYLRGTRLSALCAFTADRAFIDWRFMEGTFTAELIDVSLDQMLLQPRPHGEPPLVQQYRVVLWDNASTHSDDIEQRINNANPGHCRVVRMPAYSAAQLSPLDNGGFGLMDRYMHVHAQRLAGRCMADVFHETLVNCCDSDGARYCFRNCKYYSKYD